MAFLPGELFRGAVFPQPGAQEPTTEQQSDQGRVVITTPSNYTTFSHWSRSMVMIESKP